MAMLVMGLSPEALAIALIFHTYMRPGEGVNLLCEDVVPPIPGIKDYQAFGIILAPRIRKAVGLIGLDSFELSLYQLRHGGASREALTRRRDLQGIIDRSNWACVYSVKRSVKTAGIQQAPARSPSRTLALCRASMVHLQAAINSGRCLVELP